MSEQLSVGVSEYQDDILYVLFYCNRVVMTPVNTHIQAGIRRFRHIF